MKELNHIEVSPESVHVTAELKMFSKNYQDVNPSYSFG